MKRYELGSTGIFVAPIIMGTWQAGKDMWAGIEDQETTKAIKAAVEAGMNVIDTAEVYGSGHSERIVAQAISGIREKVVLATKVFANHLSSDEVLKACHRSLRNLKTDTIDLYQIHWPAGSFGTAQVPVGETMSALNRLKEDGKIRAIGVSNFSRQQIEEASQHGEIVSLQPPYSLLWRQMENESLAYCQSQNIVVLAYSPMAQGILSGKFGSTPSFAKGDHRSKNKLFQPTVFRHVLKALAKLKTIAERNEMTMAQLALAWVISHDGVCAIAGARNAKQAIENAQAAETVLSSEDLTEMDRISREVNDQLPESKMMWNF
jgi:aryl-alcohol dehydrogenase-like predicted oxidoreductase